MFLMAIILTSRGMLLMKDKVREIKFSHLDKWKVPTADRNDKDGYRFSVFFNYTDDNYHIHIPKNVDRETVGKLLRDLSNLILTKGEIK